MSRLARPIRPTKPGLYRRLADGDLSDVPPAPLEPEAPPVALLEPATEPDHEPESPEDEL